MGGTDLPGDIIMELLECCLLTATSKKATVSLCRKMIPSLSPAIANIRRKRNQKVQESSQFMARIRRWHDCNLAIWIWCPWTIFSAFKPSIKFTMESEKTNAGSRIGDISKFSNATIWYQNPKKHSITYTPRFSTETLISLPPRRRWKLRSTVYWKI